MCDLRLTIFFERKLAIKKILAIENYARKLQCAITVIRQNQISNGPANKKKTMLSKNITIFIKKYWTSFSFRLKKRVQKELMEHTNTQKRSGALCHFG